jgi:6-phosphogluconolactonase
MHGGTGKLGAAGSAWVRGDRSMNSNECIETLRWSRSEIIAISGAMKTSLRHAPLALLLAVLGPLGCAVDTTPAFEAATESSAQDLISGRVGAVYTLSNDPTANEVIVFRRSSTGGLQRAASVATGGQGSGDGLGSQGAIVVSDDRHWLYAVNAGSNELSVFFVQGELVYLVDCIPTGGARPISVTVHGGLAYVLHAGNTTTPGGITGFRQRSDGTLAPLSSSSRPLSAAAVGPAQISFSPSGRALLVTEKGTNSIDEYRVDDSGRAGAPLVHAATGMTPFGFAITRHGQAIVSDAFGGAAGAGAVSSYQLDGVSGLEAVSSAVPDTESAPCWVVLAKDDHVAFVSNTASGSVSSYTVGNDGSVALVSGGARAGETGQGSKPIDMALTRNDGFLYVLDSGTHKLSAFHVGAGGSLGASGETDGLPATAVGLAAQ